MADPSCPKSVTRVQKFATNFPFCAGKDQFRNVPPLVDWQLFSTGSAADAGSADARVEADAGATGAAALVPLHPSAATMAAAASHAETNRGPRIDCDRFVISFPFLFRFSVQSPFITARGAYERRRSRGAHRRCCAGCAPARAGP